MPRLPELWVGEDEAARVVKRTTRTIRSWAYQKHIRYRTSPSGRLYEVSQLLAARDAARARYENRPIIAGPGRPARNTEGMQHD